MRKLACPGLAVALLPLGLLLSSGCSHRPGLDAGIVPDAAGGSDSPSATGGAGGADAPAGTDGAIERDAGASGSDSPPDVSVGGSGGTGGIVATGGTTTGGGGTSAAAATISGGATAGDGGAIGGGGTSAGGATPPSCVGLAATCGSAGNESCCASLPVPGGTFYRSYDNVTYTNMSYPATVDSFTLDKYEITVGRFRRFVNAGLGTQASPPAPGAGAHPLIAGSGWDSAWNADLPADTATLTAKLKCSATDQTWTDAAGDNEDRPQNCMDWYTAFAFCAWDGARLPTEAEWNYAAVGGDEQRVYPWSSPPTSTTIDDSYAVYCGSSCDSSQNVGSKSPKGDGKWGQADLAGNLWEWMLDWQSSYQVPCSNCAIVIAANADSRVMRGGRYYGKAANLLSAYRGGAQPELHNWYVGARCARSSLE
jgi:formylglycine-generating enzyme